MMKHLILLTVIIAAGIIAIMTGQNSVTNNPFPPHVSTEDVPAPEICFTPMGEQEKVCLDHFRGKVVLINFWATWCPPCIKEFPLLIDLATRYPEKMRLLLFSGDGNAQAIRHFILTLPEARTTEEDALFPHHRNIYTIHDKQQAIAREAFSTFRYPETLLIDAEGNIRLKIAGMLDDATLEILESYIKNHE